jgi:hypothetical protein
VTLNTQNQSINQSINPAFEQGIIINNLSGRFNLCYCDSEIDDILLVSSKFYLRNPDWKYKVWNMASTKFVCLFVLWCLTTISTIFQLYRRCQFYWWRIWRKPPTCGNHQLRGGRSRSNRREPPTVGKQLANFITCGCESSAPFFVIYKAGCEPTPYW